MADRQRCVCGAEIEWRPYRPLPFPEIATEDQQKRQERGGRWVHPLPDGDYDEWCSLQRARPAQSESEGSEQTTPLSDGRLGAGPTA